MRTKQYIRTLVIVFWGLGILPGFQPLAQGAGVSGSRAADSPETRQVAGQNGELPAQSDSSWWTRERLTGDWGGLRTDLAGRGVTLDFFSTGFYQGMFEGTGEKDFDLGGRFDALIHFDTGKLGLWQGGGLHTHIESNFGSAPAWYGGSLWPSNTGLVLPLGEHERLVASSLYLSQRLSDCASLMVGKVNVVDLLAADPFYGGWGNTRFMNVAFVAPPSGVLPPTIMGGILNYQVQPITWTFMAYDPSDMTGDYWVDELFSDGVNLSLAVTWAGKLAGRASSVNLNGIYSTREKADLRDYLLPPDLKTRTKDGSWHFSAKVTHLLIESAELPGKGLGLYGKVGVSDGNPNPIQGSFSGGLAAHGMIAGRPNDVFGLGYFYYKFSDDLQDATAAVTNLDDEQGLELFYNCAVTPWLRISPDLQWIDPANGDNDQVWVGVFRASVTF